MNEKQLFFNYFKIIFCLESVLTVFYLTMLLNFMSLPYIFKEDVGFFVLFH